MLTPSMRNWFGRSSQATVSMLMPPDIADPPEPVGEPVPPPEPEIAPLWSPERFAVTDALGRKWQCATVQLDFQQPINFDMGYVGGDNTRHRPIVIHRAIFGSFERFIGVLLEHTAGVLPTWLSPVQAVVVPITDKVADYAWQVGRTLEAAGVRVEVDDRGEKMGLKIREATMRKTPYMLVVGEEEAAAGTVSVRTYRTGEKPAMTIAEVAAEIAELVRSRTFDVDIKPLRTFDDVEDTAATAGADEY